MAYSNANYLMSPNRLSTKVHHAPGGASSLSLAWEDTEKPKRENTRLLEQHSNRRYTENSQVYTPTLTQTPNQLPNSDYIIQKNNYEPSYSGFLSMSQSNRLLEEELQYYKNRNKMLRSNLFANQENVEYPNYLLKNQQRSYQLQSSKYRDDDYFSRSQDYGQGRASQTEELEMAILQQQKKRDIQKQQWNYNGYYAMGQFGGQIIEKPSVKVSNPPGGRSSIVFG